MTLMPKTMRAIIATESGEADVLKLTKRPVPEPGPGELLVRVAAAGVNRPDIMQRRGVFALPPGVTDVLGLEMAGEVVAAGAGVTDDWLGRRVACLVSGGGYADYCPCAADHCLPVPHGLSNIEAAALPEAVFTVWHNLFELGALTMGETVLIHGGASGVGTTAIQLARAAGAMPLATVGNAKKAEMVRSLGAIAIEYKSEDFVAAALEATGGRGVDVVLDIVGGSYVARNLEAMAPGGRHVSLSFFEGAEVAIDLAKVMAKSLHLTSSTLRPKSKADKARLAQAIERHVWPLVQAGQLKPILYQQSPLEEAAKAHRILERNENTGKVVLLCGE